VRCVLKKVFSSWVIMCESSMTGLLLQSRSWRYVLIIVTFLCEHIVLTCCKSLQVPLQSLSSSTVPFSFTDFLHYRLQMVICFCLWWYWGYMFVYKSYSFSCMFHFAWRMIQDLYFIFGYSQIWLNLPRDDTHFFYIFQQTAITFPTTRIPKKKAQIVYCIRNIEVTFNSSL